MRTLLVMTTGQTDVQLVVNEQRHKLDGSSCGTLHDAIKERSWSVVDAPKGRSRDLIKALPAGELRLCTPKLDAVLAHLDSSLPTSALILETTRQDAEDPRFAGQVMERRLRERGVQTVHRVAYLTGEDRLEDRDTPQDSVIRRDVVRRLEGAVRDTIAAASPSRIVVATTGGFPVVGPLVEEIVRLHATEDVEALEVQDGAKAKPPAADRAVTRTSVPEPLTSFQARRRVLELIRGGSLLGAWAVAVPLHGEASERCWTQTVEWLALFASSLPLPESCDLAVLGHRRMAVRAALRVELALRAGDVPRAVHGTVAFFETALWDHLCARTSRHPAERKFRFEQPPPAALVREQDETKLGEFSKSQRKENDNRPFIPKDLADGTQWYWIDDKEASATKIAEHYLQLDGLTRLAKAVGRDIRNLRNDASHNEPTPALMNDARNRMQSALLWSSDDTFLSQALVQAVLKELGEEHPENLLANLLAEVRCRLVAGSSSSAP